MIDKKKLYQLYYVNKLSMVDVAKEIGTTPATIEYWMNKHGFNRRDPSESAYVKQNPNGDPFEIKRKLTSREKELFIAGLMLYWSEGGKSQKYSVQLGNLDCKMLKVFLKFLRQICRIDEDRLGLQVRVYRRFNKRKAASHWSRLLKIPQNRISAHVHTDRRSNPNKQWSPHGIATLQFSNKKFREWLDETIEKYTDELAYARKSNK